MHILGARYCQSVVLLSLSETKNCFFRDSTTKTKWGIFFLINVVIKNESSFLKTRVTHTSERFLKPF